LIPWNLLWAHARRGPLRTLLTAGSVAVALFLYCCLRTVVTTIENTVKEANASRLIVQSAVSLFAHLQMSMKPKIEAVPGVAAMTHWTWFGGLYRDESPENFFARFAVDVPGMRRVYGDLGPGDVFVPTEQWEAFEREKGSCIVGRGLVERFKDAEGNSLFAVGSVVPFRGNIFPGDYRLTVRGIYESRNPAFDEQTLFFHWDYLDEVCERKGEVSLFVLYLEDPSRHEEVALAVDAIFRSSDTRTRTLTESAFNKQFQGMWGNIPVFLSFIGGAVLFAAFMVTLNTLLLNARERLAEVGVLKTLGFPDGAIGAANLAEALLLCGAGGLIGAGTAHLLFNLLPLGKTIEMWFPGFRVVPATLAEALALALLLGLVSGVVPCVMAARIPVVKALRRIG
jgi:putative ABC transport system permease protein